MFTVPNRLSPSKLQAAVEAADDMDLIDALIEPDDGVDMQPMDEESFYCPVCQAVPRQWILHWLAACFGSEVTWWCTLCGAVGTRWTLIRLVLESPAALARFQARWLQTA